MFIKYENLFQLSMSLSGLVVTLLLVLSLVTYLTSICPRRFLTLTLNTEDSIIPHLPGASITVRLSPGELVMSSLRLTWASLA